MSFHALSLIFSVHVDTYELYYSQHSNCQIPTSQCCTIHSELYYSQHSNCQIPTSQCRTIHSELYYSQHSNCQIPTSQCRTIHSQQYSTLIHCRTLIKNHSSQHHQNMEHTTTCHNLTQQQNNRLTTQISIAICNSQFPHHHRIRYAWENTVTVSRGCIETPNLLVSSPTHITIQLLMAKLQNSNHETTIHRHTKIR